MRDIACPWGINIFIVQNGFCGSLGGFYRQTYGVYQFAVLLQSKKRLISFLNSQKFKFLFNGIIFVWSIFQFSVFFIIFTFNVTKYD